MGVSDMQSSYPVERSPRRLPFRAPAGSLLVLALAAAAPCTTSRAQVTEIQLGDVAAGGDGTGTAPPENVGIHPDSGDLVTSHINSPIMIGDGTGLQAVDDAVSTFIDSVFIINVADMPINTSGATFTFPPEDLLVPPETWDEILKDRIGGEDFPLSIGGTVFEHGVGIHLAAGITFDRDALRAAQGDDAVGEVSAFAGMGDSPSCLAS